MNVKTIVLIVVLIALLGAAALYVVIQRMSEPQEFRTDAAGYADCVAEGGTILESFPRQCLTRDGRAFADDFDREAMQARISYQNTSIEEINVRIPVADAVTDKTFTTLGEARGTWFFEGSFPIEVTDAGGRLIARGTATGLVDMETESRIPFNATIEAPESFMGPAFLVLKKANPEALPENDASVSIPITID